MSKTRLWVRWVIANGLAEVVALGIAGIAAMIAVGRALYAPSILSIVLAGVAVAAVGALAGIVLGWAQWIVLRGALPTIRARDWVAATAIGGIVSWLVAMTPNTVLGLAASDTGVAPEIPMAALLASEVSGGITGQVISVDGGYKV